MSCGQFCFGTDVFDNPSKLRHIVCCYRCEVLRKPLAGSSSHFILSNANEYRGLMRYEDKLTPCTPWWNVGRVNSVWTSVLDGGEWSASRLGRFTTVTKFRYPLSRRLARLQSRYGHFGERKNFLFLLGIKSGQSSPYDSLCTNYPLVTDDLS